MLAPAFAMMFALGEPPAVAVEPGEPDWEIGRERVVVALADAGLEPVAAGAAGHRPLAIVRSSCSGDAFSVEVRLLNWDGQTYSVQRHTGTDCADPDRGVTMGAFVVDAIKASCGDRPCTPPPPVTIACGARQPKWAVRGGVGMLHAPGRRLAATGAVGIGVTRRLWRDLALDVDAVGTVLPMPQRLVDGPFGYALGRAHLLVGPARPQFEFRVGVGGGVLMAWTADPRARIGGSRHIRATGLVSTTGRLAIRVAEGWSIYAATGVGFGLPVVRLERGQRARASLGLPIVDATVGLQWRPW